MIFHQMKNIENAHTKQSHTHTETPIHATLILTLRIDINLGRSRDFTQHETDTDIFFYKKSTCV